ncbi:MAG: ACP S-malonyltransferase, partial [Acidobacteriota bacterium]
FLVPGQGSQHAGMGSLAAQAYPESREIFEAADRALGFSISRLCFEGPEEVLKLTENTQPAILATSVALHRALSARGIEPDFVAGHSLGEYTALVAAGALRLADALVLVRQRGRYMQEAVPVGEGAMAAILGLSSEQVLEVCRDAAEGEVVEPANLNGAGQVVIAGHTGAVSRATALAKERGARRTLPLPVSAPFHCRLMEPAARKLVRDLESVVFSDLCVPLLTNVDAAPIRDGHKAREALRRQVASPVRWEESVIKLAESGVSRFLEVGPGKVLSGLVRKIRKDARVWSVDGPDAVATVLEDMADG